MHIENYQHLIYNIGYCQFYLTLALLDFFPLVNLGFLHLYERHHTGCTVHRRQGSHKPVFHPAQILRHRGISNTTSPIRTRAGAVRVEINLPETSPCLRSFIRQMHDKMFDLENEGQGHWVQHSQWYSSMANINVGESHMTPFCNCSPHFRYISVSNLGPWQFR